MPERVKKSKMFKPKSLYDVDEETAPKKKIKRYLGKKHPCFGMNSKGESCKCVGTEQYSLGNWYCWRHFPDADKFEEVRKKNNVPLYSHCETGLEFIKKLISYFPDNIAMRIYHQSSPYFYKYKLNSEYLNKSFYYYYCTFEFNKIKSPMYYYNIEYIPSMDNFSLVSCIINKRILNDFVKFKLKKIDSSKDHNDIDYCVFAYRKEDLAADTIKSAWKKYRWNYRRNRMDPLKRELVSYVYHPSKIDFTIID
jgi:hypothetical protein